ncbi:MAG: hypothetical protein K2Y01_09805 [Rhabdochlamydiaceae bacterium]|nr:hypothetical protein [Rhabdochlamydiaceae bacterium]
MKPLSQLVCRTWIEKKKKESKMTLFSFLPPDDKESITHLTPPSQDLTLGFDLGKEVLQQTHESWLLPFLRHFSEKEVCFFLSSLPLSTAQSLKNALKCSRPLVQISATMQFFFQQKMMQYLLNSAPNLLPIKALPKSSLNLLVSLNTKELHLLVEFLGLHDLSVEIKQIIDNTKLKKIHSVLSKEKQLFLKGLTHKKEQVIFKRMELSRWDGEMDRLLSLLFQRGMNRLAKALYPEHSDLVWHIAHRMDMQEAQLLFSLHKSLEHPNAYAFLSKQILEVLSFLQTHNPKTPS